jgi:hypothetical protein
VHETGGVAWVWLGQAVGPPFPELPFGDANKVPLALTFTVVPCNWLQGLEGALDSAHTTFLHQTWIHETARMYPSNLELVLAESPRYETEPTPFGLRAIATRPTADGRSYVRVANFFFDRSRENPSSSDVAIAHARRMILDAIATAEAGGLPPGSALASRVARIPDPVDVIVDAAVNWRGSHDRDMAQTLMLSP